MARNTFDITKVAIPRRTISVTTPIGPESPLYKQSHRIYQLGVATPVVEGAYANTYRTGHGMVGVTTLLPGQTLIIPGSIRAG